MRISRAFVVLAIIFIGILYYFYYLNEPEPKPTLTSTEPISTEKEKILQIEIQNEKQKILEEIEKEMILSTKNNVNSQCPACICPGVEKETFPSISSQNFKKRKVICQSEDKKKPTLIFIVGAEGTGHHLFRSIYKKFPNYHSFPFDLQRSFLEVWEPTMSEEERNAALLRIHEYFEKGLYDNSGSQVPIEHKTFYLQNEFDMLSYPYDGPRNTLRRTDLHEFIEATQDYFNIKLLVTYRDPIDSIISLIRRNFWSIKDCSLVLRPRRDIFAHKPLGPCGYVTFQARVVEDSLTYLSSHLQTLSSGIYRIVSYKDITNHPLDFTHPLSEFFGVDEELIRQTLIEVIKESKGSLSILKPIELESLEKIFSPLRAQQWDHLKRDELNFKNVKSWSEIPLKEEEECYDDETN